MKIEQTYDEGRILSRMNRWRGILAIVVMLSHIWGYTGLVFLVPFNKMVTISVFLFFVLSGFGMTRSAEKKQGYIKGIYTEKIPRLFFMSLLAYLAGAAMQAILKIPGDPEIRFLPVNAAGYIETTNWYVYELAGFYILFSLTSLIRDKRACLAVTGICSAAGFVILYHTAPVEAYYNSIFGYVCGMILGSVPFAETMKKHRHGYIAGLIILAAAFGIMFAADKDSLFFALVRNLAGIGAVILLLYVSVYVDLNSKMNGRLCRISPELFFYHMPAALLLSRKIQNPYAYAGVVIAVSLILAMIFHFVDDTVHGLWKKLVLHQTNPGQKRG